MDTCTIPGCDRLARCKGLCDTHYKRRRRRLTGAALTGPVRRRDERKNAVAEFARVNVSERTRAHFERLAALKGVRVSTYVGELLDSLAAAAVSRKVG